MVDFCGCFLAKFKTGISMQHPHTLDEFFKQVRGVVDGAFKDSARVGGNMKRKAKLDGLKKADTKG